MKWGVQLRRCAYGDFADTPVVIVCAKKPRGIEKDAIIMVSVLSDGMIHGAEMLPDWKGVILDAEYSRQGKRAV
jgi:hypothetical protein